MTTHKAQANRSKMKRDDKAPLVSNLGMLSLPLLDLQYAAPRLKFLATQVEDLLRL